VARDRQRAKQRKARRAQQRGPARSQPTRSDLPGELEHASGEVDEFEAALVAGAEGQTVDDERDVRDDVDAEERTGDELEDEPSTLVGRADDDEPSALVSRPEDEDDDREAGPEELDDEAFEELEDEVDHAAQDDEVDEATLEREAVGSAPAVRRETAPGAPTRKGGGRFLGFLRASWAELQRVQWPDRRQVAQATGVVIGFVIVAGLYLGVADWVAKQIVNAII
jgi:preprotein translocase subunit SecE